MKSAFDRWMNGNALKRCAFSVPKRYSNEERHRCPFIASNGRFCKKHSEVFTRTGSERGELSKPASYWEAKYRELEEQFRLCREENKRLMEVAGEWAGVAENAIESAREGV